MPNYFLDNADLVFQFEKLDLEEVTQILEHNYSFADSFPTAPRNYLEATENYRGALEVVGELTGNFIAPRAMAVDHEGARHEKGKVSYAKGTREALDQLAKAGLMGVIVPHKFGGLNFPATIYIMMIEMVSQADASLMTLFGYQDVGEAIAKFAPEEVAEKFLIKYAQGQHTGSMVMTEPGAGSDLQAIKLQAYQDDEGQWRLKGEKQFISNGCGDVLLVLARSEPNTNNMFGLSLFACHGGDRVKVNRIEEKMGLHGSPTCALYFEDAPCYLVGKRRHGLINVLYILNHARFSVAAQALGIAEGAYQEALAYAKIREQFGKLIYQIPSVANLLIDMRVTLECDRSLLYASTQWLDLRNKLEEKIELLKASGEDYAADKQKFDQAARIIDMLSPMVKYILTENANKVCYDAQQVHGGMGYMKDMNVERLVRDVRITTIYEGTSQIQILGASKGVFGDILKSFLEERQRQSYRPELEPCLKQLQELREIFLECNQLVRDHDDSSFKEAATKELVDMYGALYTGYLVLAEAQVKDRKIMIARRFVTRSLARAHQGRVAISHAQFGDISLQDRICETGIS